MFDIEKPDFLEDKWGDKARLIPAIKDSNLEQKVTSTLLATLMAVDEFAVALLNEVGAPIGKRAKISCFTEIVCKGQKADAKNRPDGLIVVRSGSKQWMAFVEAKIGNNNLEKDQIETYLDLARQHKVDALITISNQFANLPTHHPIQVNKTKLRSTALYHWSWTSLVTQALLLEANKSVSDPDQAYLLQELIRFLQHPNSGVLSFSRMEPGWKTVCQAIHQEAPLRKSSEEVDDSVSSWNQLARYMSLQMSVAVSRPVSVYMTRSQINDPAKYTEGHITSLLNKHVLEVQFDVPDTASRIFYLADLKARKLSASMKIEAPRDKQQIKSRIGWLIKQLTKCEDNSVMIRVEWPGRTQSDLFSLGQLRADQSVVIAHTPKALPHHFEVILSIDLAGKFSAPIVFAEEATKLLINFYNSVGQHLRAWTPPPPKLKKDEVTEESDQPPSS